MYSCLVMVQNGKFMRTNPSLVKLAIESIHSTGALFVMFELALEMFVGVPHKAERF